MVEYQKSMGLLRALGRNTAYNFTNQWCCWTRYKLKSPISVDNGLVCSDSHPAQPGQDNVLFLAHFGQGFLTPPEL